MTLVPIECLKSLFDTGDADPSGEAPLQRSATPYECGVCDTVYISEDMQICPGCNESVVQVPDERQLGFGR